MRISSSLRRALAPLTLAVLSAAAISASPVAAAETERPALIHTTPKVPVVIDGVRHAPKGVHRFDGRPLYFAVAQKGKKLLAFTNAARYRAYLKRTAGLRFKPGTLEPAPVARSSRFGDYVDYYDHQAGGGPSFRIESGWAVADLRAVRRGCGLFGCAGDFDNQIASVRAWGRGTMLYDGYAFTGDTLWLPTETAGFWDLWNWGFADRASSVWAAWL